MLDLIEFMKETPHEEPASSPSILCLGCAAIIPYSDEINKCDICGAKVNLEEFLALYKYSSDALRYGYQYHEYYSQQKAAGELGTVKLCLSDLPEVYKYVALAISSGVIGGASWEVTKIVIKKIIAQFDDASNQLLDRVEPTIDLEEIDRIANDINGYSNGLGYMDRDVAAVVLEEMFADSVRDYLDELEIIHKLFEKPKKKEKNRKRALKLQKRLMEKIAMDRLNPPLKLPVSSLWDDVDR